MTMTQEQAEKMVDDLMHAVENQSGGSYAAGERAEIASMRAALIAALTAGPGVPEGWRMVPVEATEDMELAAELSEPRGYRDLYSAMLAAAPTAPAVSVADAVSAGSDDEAAALVSLVRSGIRTDIQELLIYGSKRAQVPPGALRKAIDAVFKARGQGGA